MGSAAEAVQVTGEPGSGQVAIRIVARGVVEQAGQAVAEDGSDQDIGALGDRVAVDVDRPPPVPESD